MKRAFTIIASLIISLSSLCQTLSLEQCKQLALEHNKSLSSAKVQLEKSQFDMQSYKANFFPKIDLMAMDFYSNAKGDISIDGFQLPIKKLDLATGTYNYDVTILPDGSYVYNSYTDVPDISREWKLKNIFMGGVSLMEPIYSGGKVSTAYNMSKLGVSIAKDNIRLSESEVVVNTEEAYIMAIKAKELGDVARSYQNLLQELKKNVDAAFRHGMSTRNDIMKVQVKLNEAELSIQKADNAHRLALMNLCHIIGMPLDSQIEVDAECISTKEDSATGGSIESRPEYSMLEKKTELARHNIKLTKSDYLPTVAAGASYTYANGGEVGGKKLLNNGSFSVGMAVKVPLDVFGAGSSKVRSARAAYKIAQIEQQDLNEKMQLELSLCRNSLSESALEVKLCESALEHAAENVRLSKQQYEVGLEPLSEYLETQAVWQQAGASLVQARCQYMLAQTKLRKASGVF